MILTFAIALARWLHFGAAMILFGSSLFALYAPPGAMGGAAGARLLSLQRHASWVGLVAALAWAAASVVTVTDDPASLFDIGVLGDFFLTTQFGTAWIVVLVLLISIVAAIALAPAPARLSPAFNRSIVAAAGAVLVVEAWLGHAGDGEGVSAVVEIGAYGLHVLAAAAWLGGLPMLAGFVVFARRELDSKGAAAMGSVLTRFSSMGMIAVALVILSGLANSWLRLSSPRDLLATPYGLLIDTKIALLLGLTGVAAHNRFRLMPKLKHNVGAMPALLRNIWIEQIFGAVILAAAAVLGSLSPSG